MTWSEFLEQLERCGLTQAEFGRRTGYDKHTVNRWSHRVHGIPKWVPGWLAMFRASAAKRQK